MAEIIAPKLSTDLAAQVFTWENLNIEIRVEKLNNQGDCELYVHYKKGDDNRLLRHTTAHLLSQSNIASIIRPLKSNIKVDWDTIFTYVTNLALTEYRKGEPVITLDENYGRVEPEYLLYPLFVKNAINTIYADRGSAKTLFITLIDLMLTLPWTDNPLKLNVNKHPHSVLFLDWENNPDITGWTANSLIRGMDIGYCPIQYRHCSLPLADDISQIKSRLVEVKADIIIVDSMGMAVGEDLNLTKPAFQFFAALRQLDPITTILVGHTAKNLEMRRKTVYGNAYYENEARSIWEIRKDQEPNSPELTITLYHRKPPPFAPAHTPLAYRFTFDNDITRVSLGDAKTDIREQADVTEIDIVLAILTDSKTPLNLDQIGGLSDSSLKRDHIKVYCERLIKTGKVRRVSRGVFEVTNA